jgi:uncharacterized membrane protein HdeD (DUF308 family)
MPTRPVFLREGSVMVATMGIKPTLGGGLSGGLRVISGKWGWFVALGIIDLILGGVASTNLMLANLASVLFIGAAVFVSGIFQIVHACSARRLRGFLFWLASSLVYAAAGAVILYDPVLASLELSLLAGAFLVVAGLMRAWAGFHARPAAGWRWIVAAGALTFAVGVIVIAAWPEIGVWLFGAMLVVDLIFQGWGYITFGMLLRMRTARHPHDYAAA